EPRAGGVKRTATVQESFWAIVAPLPHVVLATVKALALEPVISTFSIVTGALPGLLMVTVVSDVALPTWLDPKVTFEGFAVMPATPEMIPGTVVQKFLFSAAMRHLLSHPDRGDRVGVVQRQPQRKLRASGRAVCPQRPGRVKAKPRLPTPPGRDLRRLGQRNGELFAPIGAIPSPGLKPCPGR